MSQAVSASQTGTDLSNALTGRVREVVAIAPALVVRQLEKLSGALLGTLGKYTTQA